MSPGEIDVIVRVAGATLLLTVSAFLWLRGEARTGLFFLPLAVCLCGFLAGNTPDAALRLGGIAGDAARMLSGFAAVFLWLFCLSVFDRTFRPRGLVLATGILWLGIAAVDRGILGEALASKGLSWALIAICLGMVIHLAWRLIRDRPGDLIDERRSARVLVVLLLGGQLLADLLIDVVMGLDWQPRSFSIVQNAAVLVFTGWLLHLQVRPSEPRPAFAVRSAVDPAPVQITLSPEAIRLRERLRVLIEEERIHLDPDLTFDRFVALMGASDRTVRLLINQQLGHDHFRTFLNSHRLTEARRLLADPAHRHDKLISIAMDSGFASLASFNRVFHDAEACSPGAWLQATLGIARAPTVTEWGTMPPFETRSADS
ncbi:helix-turn-helix domain-containing protein [Brevundimonas sp. R86498]|uniref:helix-turn-helix domain-containing protein n=1 Tax=Brevundimonas sp. R86498 TaxID=3093845 RepID=UPI0037C5144D